MDALRKRSQAIGLGAVGKGAVSQDAPRRSRKKPPKPEPTKSKPPDPKKESRPSAPVPGLKSQRSSKPLKGPEIPPRKSSRREKDTGNTASSGPSKVRLPISKESPRVKDLERKKAPRVKIEPTLTPLTSGESSAESGVSSSGESESEEDPPSHDQRRLPNLALVSSSESEGEGDLLEQGHSDTPYSSSLSEASGSSESAWSGTMGSNTSLYSGASLSRNEDIEEIRRLEQRLRSAELKCEKLTAKLEKFKKRRQRVALENAKLSPGSPRKGPLKDYLILGFKVKISRAKPYVVSISESSQEGLRPEWGDTIKELIQDAPNPHGLARLTLWESADREFPVGPYLRKHLVGILTNRGAVFHQRLSILAHQSGEVVHH